MSTSMGTLQEGCKRGVYEILEKYMSLEDTDQLLDIAKEELFMSCPPMAHGIFGTLP